MENFNGKIIPSGARPTESGFEGSVRGVKYETTVSQADGRVELVIEMKRNFPVSIGIRREEGGGFFRRIGFSRKISTDDPAFDRRINLVTNDQAVARAFMDGDRRSAILSLFNTFSELDWMSYGPSHMMLTLTEMDNVDSARVAAILEAAAAACDESGPLPEEKNDWLTFGVLVFNIILFLTGALILIASPSDAVLMGSYRGRMYTWLGISMAVYLAVTAFIVRGKSNSGARLVFFALTAAFGFLMLYSGVFNTLNVRLDNTPPRVERAVVRDAYVSQSGKSMRRVLVLLPEESAESYSVIARRDIFRTVQRGDEVVIYIRPGRFNIPWFTLYGD